MSDRLKRLYDERGRAWDAMQSIRALIEKENRDFTVDERATWDKAEADITSFTADIDRENRAVQLDTALAAPVETPELRGTGSPVNTPAEVDEARVSEAFTSFLRHGMDGLSPENRAIMAPRYEQLGGEVRAQSIGTTTAGGFLVPPGYWLRISEVLKAYGGILGISNVITTATGQPLQWPNNDDTANIGAILGENTVVTEVDVTLGQRILNAWTYSSNSILVSLQLLQDSAFDLDSFITRKLGMRVGRALAIHLATGTGTNQPTGIMTTVGTGVTGTTTGKVGAPQYADLVDLTHAVDPAYRAGGNVRFVMHDLTLAAIRKLVDTQGRPLWVPAQSSTTISGSNPDTILGYPITIDQAIPATAVSTKSVLFGDFEAGYVVRQVLGFNLLRLVERYADFLQVGFIGFARYDARPDDASAIKCYLSPAT